jgi:predicted regulator of Ras-like GTPase activity (Roadblock/LC7/MglB family)
MYRLSIRKKWFFCLAAVAVSLFFIVMLPNHSPEKVFKIPVYVLISAELLLSGMLSVLCYPSATPPQLIMIAASLSGSIMLLGAVGNIFSPVTQALPDLQVLISWVQLGIMNLGGLVSTLALYQLTPVESVAGAEGGLASNSPDVDTSSATRARKPGSQTGSTDAATFANPNVSPNEVSGAGARASMTNLSPQTPVDPRSSKTALPGQGDNTASRLQAQNKRNTSTYTKLSGLGGTLGSEGLTEPEGLKSVLDRLDSEEDDEQKDVQKASSDAVKAPSDQASGATPASPPVPTPNASASSIPAVDKPGTKGKDIASRLVGVVTGSQLPSIDADSLAKLDEIPTPQIKPAESKATASADLKKVVTALEGEASTPSGIGSALQKAAKNPVTSKFLKTKPAEPTKSLEPTKGAEPAKVAEPSPVAKEAPKEEESSNLFAAGVDDDVDDIFSNLAPAEAQKEFDPAAFEKEKQDIEEPKKPSVVAKETPAADNVFGAAVDDDLDDIFSSLAPAEAQREVTRADVGVTKASAAPVTSPASSPTKPAAAPAKPFAAPSKPADVAAKATPQPAKPKPLAPAEPEKSEPEKVAPAVPKGPPKDSDTLFDEEKVNDELDDIFSQLAPPEAQLTVAEREKLREQETGDHSVELTEPEEEEIAVEEAIAPEVEEEVELEPEVSEEPVLTEEEELAQTTSVEEEEVLEEPQAETESFEPSEDQDSFAPEEEGGQVALESESDATPIVNPITKNKEVKEFGRLSAKAAPQSQSSAVGTMKTIGKLLLDVSAIENIIKSGEAGTIGAGLTNARVISAARGEGIKALLVRIDGYEGVIGSLIVGHDGLVIASTVTPPLDKDTLGALSTALLSTSNLATLKLDIGKLKQMVLLTDRTADGVTTPVTTVLTDVEVGILAVLMDTQELPLLDGLLDTIHETIHG